MSSIFQGIFNITPLKLRLNIKFLSVWNGPPEEVYSWSSGELMSNYTSEIEGGGVNVP